uniref:Protein kinase domain-containing protein n=1 Tax=Glossina pallidipes TaxID=7398 RepID=A0A1A9Z1K9_GLOPL
MHPAYTIVYYALRGNNSGILNSQFSKYGCLVTDMSEIEKYTTKNIDEDVTMLLTAEVLEIIDSLHAVDIIPANIKADNIFLMKKLCYHVTHRTLQSIDFGAPIDMKLLKKGQLFSCVQNDKSLNSVEMREG